jgi:hypothetical protein
VLVPRQDMTGAERGWASGYQLKDVVRYSRGSKLARIEPRTYGTVVAVNAVENLLTIQKAAGDQVSYDPKRLSRVSIYRESEREFSVRQSPSVHRPQQATRGRKPRIGNDRENRLGASSRTGASAGDRARLRR